MRTITCVLKFRDGETLTAIASAPSPQSEVWVEYCGALTRLGSHLETSNLAFLEFFLRARAFHLRAEFEATLYGDFKGQAG